MVRASLVELLLFCMTDEVNGRFIPGGYQFPPDSGLTKMKQGIGGEVIDARTPLNGANAVRRNQ